MKIEALFFGMSRDLVGQSPITFELDAGLTVKMFREILVKNYPRLSEIDSFAIAVNESYAEDTLFLTDKDTVAIIPPVSGG